MMNNDLLEKLKTGDTSETEFEVLENYFAQSDRMDLDEILKRDWRNTDAHSIPKSISNQIWEDIKPSISHNPKRVRLNPKYAKLALGVLGLLLVAFIASRFFTGKGSLTFGSETRENNSDSIESFKLGDGTVVWLNTNSSIKWIKPFRGNYKDIWVTGEAFFESDKADHRPFRIRFDGFMAEIYSKKFNIEAFSTSSQIKLGVLEGRAKIVTEKRLNPSAKGTFIPEGNQGFYNKELRNVKSYPIEESNVLAWKNGKIGFDGDPLEMVLLQLEKKLGKTFEYNQASIANCEVNGVFEPDVNPKTMLRKILHPNNIWFRERGDKYVLTGKGCS